MHPEAYDGFGWAIKESGLDVESPLTVLDIGGQMVNGSVHDQFWDAAITTLDLENATIIADATNWRSDLRFDVVMATEVFEHVKDWQLVVRTMRHHLDPEGAGIFLATCASFGRPQHGATGAPLPAPGEHYENVLTLELEQVLRRHFRVFDVKYQYPPGDAYMWGRL